MPALWEGLKMRFHFWKVGLFLLLGLLFPSLVAYAQITGDLQITVSDPTGAAVPNAPITVRNLETGATRTAQTDSSGNVRVTQLAIGQYEVKVTQAGFATVTTTAQVSSGNATTVQVGLSVAQSTQTLDVEAAATAVNTTNAQLQT